MHLSRPCDARSGKLEAGVRAMEKALDEFGLAVVHGFWMAINGTPGNIRAVRERG